jgi:uncharacterized protein YhjY with autotransporter beta-barrel domain
MLRPMDRVLPLWRQFWLPLLLLAAVLIGSNAGAQSFSGVQITRTGAPYTIGARSIPTTQTTARIIAVQSFAGDTIATGAPAVIALTPDGLGTLGFQYTMGMGATPGVRILRFCTDNGVVACNANAGTNIIHIGATSPINCTIDGPTSAQGGQTVTLSANCPTAGSLGPNIAIGPVVYTWTLPGGGTSPLQSIGFSGGAGIAYNFGLSASFSFFITRTVGFSDTTAPVPNTPYVTPTATTTLTFTAAAVAPTVTLSSVPAGPNYIRTRPVRLLVDVVPNGNVIESVRVLESFGDGLNQIGATMVAPPYEVQWTPSRNGDAVVVAEVKVQGIATPFGVRVRATVTDPPNPLPQVRIDDPVSGRNFDVGTSIPIRATATDADGITRVEFYSSLNGNSPNFISADTTAPYEALFPATTVQGDYRIFARAFDGINQQNDSNQVMITLGATVSVTLSVTDLSNPGSRSFTPRSQVNIPIAATLLIAGISSPAANRDLVWRIAQSDIGGDGSSCTPNDEPRQGTVRTDDLGRATISFLTGCTTGGKRIEVASADEPNVVKATIELRGPDQAISTINGANSANGGIYFVTPGQSENVSVRLASTGGASLQGGQIIWTLPASAGSLVPSISSIDNSTATTSVILAAGIDSALITACVRGRDLCTTIEVRSILIGAEEAGAEVAAPLLQAAIDAPRVQLKALSGRMQQLRNESAHGFSNQLSLNVAGLPVSTGSGSKGNDEESEDGGEQKEASKFGVFLMGDVSVNKRDSQSGTSQASLQNQGYEVRTRGVTLGADYRFTDGIAAGVALGALKGDSTSANTAQDNRGYSLSLFGQWLPSEHWYFAGVINRGSNDYDIERLANKLGSTGFDRLVSESQSKQTAAQLEAGYSFAKGLSRFTPFLRYEYIRADLDPIVETGGPQALRIDGYQSKLTTIAGGLQADWAFNTQSGVLIPGARLEFVRESDDTEQAFAQLTGGASGFLPLTPVDLDQSYGNASVSLQWLTGIKGQPISVFLGFDFQFARDQINSRSASLGVKIPF